MPEDGSNAPNVLLLNDVVIMPGRLSLTHAHCLKNTASASGRSTCRNCRKPEAGVTCCSLIFKHEIRAWHSAWRGLQAVEIGASAFIRRGTCLERMRQIRIARVYRGACRRLVLRRFGLEVFYTLESERIMVGAICTKSPEAIDDGCRSRERGAETACESHARPNSRSSFAQEAFSRIVRNLV